MKYWLIYLFIACVQIATASTTESTAPGSAVTAIMALAVDVTMVEFVLALAEFRDVSLAFGEINVWTVRVYNTLRSTFMYTSSTPPPHLSELLHLYSPSRSLRSASDTWIFRVPRMGRRTLGERSFQYIGPVVWNSLPSLCQAFVLTLFFEVKTENPSLLLCILICRSTNRSPVMHVFVVCVRACVRVCDEMSVVLCSCQRSGLLRDGAP